ncbi:hypothetical protein ACT3S4_04410 [Psychrobacter sp. AOP30-A2-5]|jgi:hypothetical protein|uniref:hypothetical protein n=1 Tax=Psychrobacter sp. AOP30-A2-5 TaxID=3457697 RepID=UPI004036D455
MIAGVQLVQTLGSLVDARIYPMIIREHDDATAPYIIYQTISSVAEVTDDGITGHEWVRVQIDVYHNDAYQCTLLANKVINAINEQIKPSIYDGQEQMHDAASDLYRQSIDYEFSQTTPTE